MTRDQEALLLTVARVLRARVYEDNYAGRADDLAALDEALGPFGPLNAAPINDAWSAWGGRLG